MKSARLRRLVARVLLAWATLGFVKQLSADDGAPTPASALTRVEVRGALVRMPDGRLMDWWNEGERGARRAVARFSSDECRTWSDVKPLFDFPRGQEGGYGTGFVSMRDRDGAVHLFGLHYIGTGPGGFDDWENAKSYIYHVKSPDNGKTWTTAQHCDFGYLYTGAVNSALQLRSGRLVVPLSYYSKRKTGKFVGKLSISDDSGTTWRPSKGEFVVDSGGHLLEGGACEPICVELKDGRLWILMRTQTGYQHESFSSDGGETWTQPVPSRFVSSNSPGFLLRMRDGRLVLAWNNSMSPYDEGNILTSYDRHVLAAAVSHDDGKTWRGYREIERVHGALRAVGYPFLTETQDDAFLCLSGGGALRVPIDWLEKTRFTETFEGGLKNWMTIGCEGVEVVDHPERKGAKMMRIHKPKSDVPAGASLNFPFGVRGEITLRILQKADPRWPGRQHCYLCLTDFFSLPRLPPFVKGFPPGGWGTFPEGGRFKLRIAPDGEIGIATGSGLFQDDFRRTKAALTPGKWHTIGMSWDCEAGSCRLTLDGKKVADLPQLSRAVGICDLRLWMNAVVIEPEGFLIERVDVRVDSR